MSRVIVYLITCLINKGNTQKPENEGQNIYKHEAYSKIRKTDFGD